MADGRLALAQLATEITHVKFLVLGKIEKNTEPGLVAQELEYLRKVAHDRLRDRGQRGHGLAVRNCCALAGCLFRHDLIQPTFHFG